MGQAISRQGEDLPFRCDGGFNREYLLFNLERMRKIENIVIHCSDTPEWKEFDIDDIRKWHVEENGWTDVGYHYVVLLDGTIQIGRALDVPGAHVKGHNAHSIGICYIGGGDGVDTRTPHQEGSLEILINYLKLVFKGVKVLGHCDFEGVTKTCPNFDAFIEYLSV